MKLNTEKIKQVLMDANVSAYSIEAETGVSRHTIAKIRRGEADWQNLQTKSLMAIQKIIDDGRYRFIQPCQNLIDDVLEDIADFGEDYLVVAMLSDEEIKEGIIIEYYDLTPPESYAVFEEDIEEYEQALQEWQRNIEDAMTKPHQIMTLQTLLQKLEYQNKI